MIYILINIYSQWACFQGHEGRWLCFVPNSIASGGGLKRNY